MRTLTFVDTDEQVETECVAHGIDERETASDPALNRPSADCPIHSENASN